MNTYQDYSRKPKLTDEKALDLGNKMQNIKDTLHKTINYVRKNINRYLSPSGAARREDF